MQACDCGTTLGNLGKVGCVPSYQITKLLIYVPLVADDGTVNEIDLATAVLDQAEFDAHINNPDPSKRWYPSPQFEDLESVRNDPTTQTLASGANLILQQGSKTFVGFHYGCTPEFAKAMKNYRCSALGAYMVDFSGNIRGNNKIEGKLRPIEIDNNTFLATVGDLSYTVKENVRINFEWARSECDEDLRMILASEMGADVSGLRGLIDVNGQNVSTTSTADFKVELISKYGSALNPRPITGLVAGDFDLYNETTMLTVAILTATENPDGTFEFTFAGQTALDELQLSITKDGYDSTDLEAVDIIL